MYDYFMNDYLYGFLFAIGLIAFAFVTGRIAERRHLRSLAKREEQFRHIVTTNVRKYPDSWTIHNSQFVHGQATVGSDHFKTTMTKIRQFFGGRLRSIEHLMTRSRREALLRLLVEADALGATHVLNIRFESSSISGSRMIASEIYAYGTAIVAEAE
ncbi:MAG: heavy metal-binding domain-containing protein [Candidatus Hydrogenedentota bacterium]